MTSEQDQTGSSSAASSPDRRPELDRTFVPQETASDAAGPAEVVGNVQDWVGKSLGKYRVTAVLGQGGMGMVLKAFDPLIERDVAIKLLAQPRGTDSIALGRFLSEARSAGKLNHPNLCSIYEIGQEGNTYYLVMEYIPGGSLSDKIEKHGPCSVLYATQALADACRGVSAAHAAGLIHRDIKPANFMRGLDGSIKVSDFGLAKTTSADAFQFTQAGMVVGTPFFMSPEQCEARPVDARCDIYSLGAAYYCLLTGRNPYDDSNSVPQVMYNHCHGPVPDPRTVVPDVPEACVRIVARAMSKSPAERYQTADAMLADLQAVAATLTGQTIALPSESGLRPAVAARSGTNAPTAPRRRWPLLLAVGGGIVAALAFAFFGRGDKAPTGGAAALAATGEPIKVGVLHSLSGTMATSEMVVVDATLFAIEQVNAAGGIGGRPLKAIVADGRSDPAVFASEAERLITQEKVCTVFGCWTSSSRKTVKPVFEEHDHLLMYPLQYEGIETSPNIVYLGAAPNQQILPAIDWAVNTLGKKRFFLIGSDYVFPHTANEVIKDRLRELGAEVAGESYVPLGGQELLPTVNEIVAAKPDMILNTINGDSNTAFFRALRGAGMTAADCPCMSFSVGEQELRSLDLSALEGDYAAWTYFQSVATPENKKFVEEFYEKYPQRSVTDPMEAAYSGVKIWAQAAREAESLDPKKIRRAILNQRFRAPSGEMRVDADTQHCFKTPRIGKIRSDGQFEIVWTADAPVRPAPFPPSRKAAEWKVFLNDLYTGWGNQWAAPAGKR